MRLKVAASKNTLVYIVIVILPTLISSILFTRIHYQQTLDSQANITSEFVNFHKNYIDRFVGETIASIETLSIVLQNKESNEEIEKILMNVQEKDERFSGLYWANTDGDLIISTNEMKKKVNISHREYFQQVLDTKETRVSPAHIGSVTGRYIVTIATPVLNSRNIDGVLLVSLRLDYLENVLRVLTPDALIRVIDNSDQILISTNQDYDSVDTDVVSARLDNVFWTIEAKPKIPAKAKRIFIINSIIFSCIMLFLTHILFLFGKYKLLKRQAKKERAENEIQKLELVGSLAASTAHEIKNPLTGIKGLIQLLGEKHRDQSDQFYFSVIQQEITRINDIVNEFLVLGKPTADKLANYDLNEIVRELEPIIQSESNHYNLLFELKLEDTPLRVSCSKDNIKQLILNLSKNAIESMHTSKGTLSIAVKRDGTDSLLVISDTGGGIPEHVFSKLFTPFYTSKETGTGLGLVICERIVHMYNGTIDIESKEGKGTTVYVRFPLSALDENLTTIKTSSTSLFS